MESNLSVLKKSTSVSVDLTKIPGRSGWTVVELFYLLAKMLFMNDHIEELKHSYRLSSSTVILRHEQIRNIDYAQKQLTITPMSMETEKDISVASQLIHYNPTMTLATVSEAYKPWSSHCLVAYDEEINFFWSSPWESKHSENIRTRGGVVLSACNDNMPPNEGLGRGVYISATATEIDDEEQAYWAMKHLSTRNGKRPMRNASAFLEGAVRLYQAVPDEIRVNKTSVDESGFIISSSHAVSLNGVIRTLELMRL
jgi:pyridoxamine 5'-phosphate oxidase-like protein